MATLRLPLRSLWATTSASAAKKSTKPMLKIEQLMVAMATHEGWKNSLADTVNKGSMSWRHHNPGNLRASPLAVGTQDGFAVFNTDMDGWAAFKFDLMQKAKGNTSSGLNGSSTLKDLIYKWAPPSDGNNTETYLTEVCAMTGFSTSMPLSKLVEI